MNTLKFQASSLSTDASAEPLGDLGADDKGLLATAFSYSPPGLLYGYMTGAAEKEVAATPASGKAYVDVEDSAKNVFTVKSNGMIEIIKGDNVGKLFTPGKGAYSLILSNLAKVPGNAQLLAEVLGGDKVVAAAKAAKQQPPAVVAQAEELAVIPPEKLTDKAWFWPAVIGVSVVGIGAAIIYWPRS